MSTVARLLSAAAGSATLVCLAASPVLAQGPVLAFHEGRVTVKASDVPVRHLLEEWSRLGQTRVVNADRLGDRRVSLQLDRVPEGDALARILEAAAGYVARRRTGPDGPSGFGLILVLSDPASADGTGMAGAGASPAASTSPQVDVEPAVPASAASDTETATLTPDPDSTPTAASTDADGRAPGTRAGAPMAATGGLAPAPSDVPLSDGRPEGTRPDRPSTLSAPVPAPVDSLRPGPAGTLDANGRPVKRS